MTFFNPILQMVEQGVSSDAIAALMSKASPKIARKIQQMLLGGYGTSEILRFLAHDKGSKKQMKMPGRPTTPAEIAYMAKIQNEMNVPKGRDQQALADLKRITPSVLGATALGLGATALGAETGMAIGEQIGFQPPSPGPQPTGQEPQPIQQEPTPQPIELTPEAPIEPQKEPPNPQAIELIDKMKYGNMIKKMVEQNQPIENIEGTVNHFLGAKGRSWLKKQTKDPLSKIIKDYLTITKGLRKQEDEALPTPEQETPTQEQPIPPEAKPIEEPTRQPPPIEFEPIKEPIKPIEEKPRKEVKLTKDLQPEPTKFEPGKDKKGEVVQTSGGETGTIEGLDGSGALVRIGGKLKKVKFEDLLGQTETVKNAKILMDPKEVPEEERSAALGMVLTPPDRKDISVMFGPSGKFYRYFRKDGSPIEEDIVKELEVGQRFPITTGRTFMGAWDADEEDSRGTVAYKRLVAQAQKMGKEDDPKKQYWFQEVDSTFTHGFISKFLKLLQEGEKAFRPRKRKKKK